jgi:hypothetical protein
MTYITEEQNTNPKKEKTNPKNTQTNTQAKKAKKVQKTHKTPNKRKTKRKYLNHFLPFMLMGEWRWWPCL